MWEFNTWNAAPMASIGLATHLPTAEFDSIFPYAPTGRDCLPQPGVINPDLFLDVLPYRQRPLWRLPHRTSATTSPKQAREAPTRRRCPWPMRSSSAAPHERVPPSAQRPLSSGNHSSEELPAKVLDDVASVVGAEVTLLRRGRRATTS